MPGVNHSSRHAPFKRLAEAQNSVDALLTQQQGGVYAPVPGAALSTADPNQVISTGLIPTSPAGTPGGEGPAYGMQFFDLLPGRVPSTLLRMQIDQWGVHLYSVGGAGTKADPAYSVYSSELVTY